MRNKSYRKDSHQLRSQPRKKLLWILLVILVIGGILVILEITGVTNFIKPHKAPTPSSSGPTPEQKQQEDATNAELKKQVIEGDKGTNTTTSSGTPATGSIGLTAQLAANNSVTVFTTLRGYSDGSCLLTITNAGKTATQSAPVIYQRDASSCAGFSVPIDPLGKGTWALKLDVTSNGATNSKNITYEVK